MKFDNKIYEIPVFIIKNEYENIDNENIQKGLIFSRTLMENKFFIPNNLRFPYSRRLLEKKIF